MANSSSSFGAYEADARSLADKLAAFTDTLSPREAAILALAMQGASAGEVEGYGWWDTRSADGWFGVLTKSLVNTSLYSGAFVLDEEAFLEMYGPDGGKQTTGQARPATAGRRGAEPVAAS